MRRTLFISFCAGLFFTMCGRSAAGTASAVESWRGVFEPRAQAVIPSEVSMRVLSMPKGPGDFCRTGEVLVEFDSDLARAAVTAATAKLDAARLNRDGLARLFERNQATAVELSGADAAAAGAELELAAARREAAACRVTAPFDGKLVEWRVREFEWAGKGEPLLLLVDDSVLQARFFLPEGEYERIRVGDNIAIDVPAAGTQVTGVVTRLGVVFDPVSRTFDVWADVDNAGGLLRAGMTAEVLWQSGGGEGTEE